MPEYIEKSIEECLEAFGQTQAHLLGNKGYLAENYRGNGNGNGSSVVNPLEKSILRGLPWEEAPPGYQQFDQQQVLALPLVGAAEAVVLTLIVPRGMDGIIKWYSCNFAGGGFVNGSGDIVWRIRSNLRAVLNFDNILTERGTVDRPRELKPGIRIYNANVVTFTVEHVANALLGAEPIICSLAGYFYPSMGS